MIQRRRLRPRAVDDCVQELSTTTFVVGQRCVAPPTPEHYPGAPSGATAAADCEIDRASSHFVNFHAVCASIWRKFLLSRRRRTFVLCQHSTQQAQTRMSRSANVCALKRRKSCVGTQPATMRRALALGNHWKSIPEPVRSPQKLSDTIRSEFLRRDAQPKWGHARASFREMVPFCMGLPSDPGFSRGSAKIL